MIQFPLAVNPDTVKGSPKVAGSVPGEFDAPYNFMNDLIGEAPQGFLLNEADIIKKIESGAGQAIEINPQYQAYLKKILETYKTQEGQNS